MKHGVVIVGTGHGGVQAAASLREEGYDGPVTLIGDETDFPYHKPPLSKAFLKEANAGPQALRGETFFSANAIGLRPGTRVERIDRATGRLELAGGGSISFDHLVLATGSRPRDLVLSEPMPAGVLSLRTLSDARLIREAAAQAGEVVVLGGGFIGLEIAATLAAGGRRVTVIEAQDRPLGRAVAPALSAHVTQRLESFGVRLLTRTVVEGLEGADGRVTGVRTSAGERIPAQMVIVGIGVVPNVELAQAAGLEIMNGIRVDAQMRTANPRILAIGDCANFRHWFAGTDVRLESVQNATDQARLAARTIMGHEDSYAAVPWFWSDIGDMKLQMVGLCAGSDAQVVAGEPEENRFSIYHYSAGQLIAIESVNRPADHMLGRRMLGAGFSPSQEIAAQGPDAVKAAFQSFTKAA